MFDVDSPNAECRADPRYRPMYDTYIIMQEKAPRIGQLINIGMGGLSCRVVHPDSFGLVTSFVDIFTASQNWQLTGVPVRMIYCHDDKGAIENDKRNGLNIYGAHFLALNNAQVQKLDEFMASYVKKA